MAKCVCKLLDDESSLFICISACIFQIAGLCGVIVDITYFMMLVTSWPYFEVADDTPGRYLTITHVEFLRMTSLKVSSTYFSDKISTTLGKNGTLIESLCWLAICLSKLFSQKPLLVKMFTYKLRFHNNVRQKKIPLE